MGRKRTGVKRRGKDVGSYFIIISYCVSGTDEARYFHERSVTRSDVAVASVKESVIIQTDRCSGPFIGEAQGNARRNQTTAHPVWVELEVAGVKKEWASGGTRTHYKERMLCVVR